MRFSRLVSFGLSLLLLSASSLAQQSTTTGVHHRPAALFPKLCSLLHRSGNQERSERFARHRVTANQQCLGPNRGFASTPHSIGYLPRSAHLSPCRTFV